MRAARLSIALFAAAALALGACGGDEPPVDIGSEITFEVPAARGQPQAIVLRGIVRGSGTVGVVLAHMLNSSQTAWTPLVAELVGRGLHVLTFDFRGHGLSRGDRNPSLADLDLAGAVAKLRSLGATKVFVVGASTGGSAAVAVAATEDLEGVIAISAPVEAGELRVDEAVRTLDEPSLFIVAEKDEMRYVDAARALEAAAPEPKRLEVIRGVSGHGTDLLIDETAGERVETIIVEFLSDYGG
jgi:pimeloyl-ACP methyl ester carboxylesterase